MASAANFDGLDRCFPEEKGVQSALILDFLTDAETLGIHLNSFMLYRRGAVISEGWWTPYRRELRHMIHSATKSFLSTAVGLAIQEGHFSLEDKVVSFFPQHVPPILDSKLASMTVEDLLTQTSGHATGASGGTWRSIKTSWIAEFFKIPVQYEPKAHFKYSSATSFMLSAIIQSTTGQSTHDFLLPRLLRPLGITDLSWDVGPEGINPGGNGISCRSSDLLKLAILHLQKGVWKGRRILSEDWVTNATRSQRGNSYGYQWWIGEDDAYFAYGLFGQFAFVFPHDEAILVTTSSEPPGEVALRSLVWRHAKLMFDASADPMLAPGGELQSFLMGLHVPVPLKRSGLMQTINVSDRLFVAKSNIDDVYCFSFVFTSDRCVFQLQDHRGLHRIDVGLHGWLEGETSISGAPLHHGYQANVMTVMAQGAWSSSNAFEMVWQFTETAFQDRLTLTIVNDDEAVLERGVNVNSFATQRPPIAAYILKQGTAPLISLKTTTDVITQAREKANLLNVATRTVPFSTTSASLDELLCNADTKAVLEREVPDLITSPHLERMKQYNLVNLAANSVQISADLLEKLDAELGRVLLPQR